VGNNRRIQVVGQFAIWKRAFRASARIGAPISLAAQKKLARDDKVDCVPKTTKANWPTTRIRRDSRVSRHLWYPARLIPARISSPSCTLGPRHNWVASGGP